MTEQRIGAVRFLLRHFWAFRSFSFQATVIVVLMAVVNLPLPLLNKVAIDTLVPAGQLTPLILIGVLAFFVRSMASAFQVFQNYLIRRVMAGIGDQLRRQLIQSMLRAPYERFVTGEISGYVGRISTDVQKVESVIFDTIRFVVRPVSMLFVMVGVMSFINVPATLLILAASPVSILFTRKLRRDLTTYQTEVLSRRQDVQQQVAEVLDNVRVIRTFSREKTYMDRVEETILGYTKSAVKHATRQHLISTIVELITMIPWLILVVGGAILIRRGEISLGDLMAFIAFEQLMHSPLGQLSIYILKVKSDLIAPQRIQEVVEVESEPSGAIELPELKGQVRFCDVSFSYVEGIRVLDGFDHTIEAGERIAVVGPSGAGKTTLVNLMLGFYRPTDGVIRIDGHPLDDIRTQDLRSAIGVVFQDNPMFDATVRDNLTLYESDICDDQIWDALALSDAADFVRSLPDGLDTLVGVKGLKLSGGQRQRLAIARVILKDPRIVLMDEATSSLDSVSESQIQRALDLMLRNRTSLTIAHRLSTVIRADRILYLDHGRVVEQGTHRELAKAGGPYSRLLKAQTEGLLIMD